MERHQKGKRRKIGSTEGASDSTLARALACSIISGAVSTALALILTAICSLVALSQKDPDKIISVLGIAIPAVSYLLSGIVSYKLSHRAPLVCGVVSSVTLMLLLKFASFVLKLGADATFGAPIKAILCVLYILSGILGSIIAANLSFSSKKGSKKRVGARK